MGRWCCAGRRLGQPPRAAWAWGASWGRRASSLFCEQPAAPGQAGKRGRKGLTASGRSGRNEGAGSAPTPSLSTHILSSQGSRLSELRGPQACPPLLLACLHSGCFCSKEGLLHHTSKPNTKASPAGASSRLPFPRSACLWPPQIQLHHTPGPSTGPTVHRPASPERRACTSEHRADLQGRGTGWSQQPACKPSVFSQAPTVCWALPAAWARVRTRQRLPLSSGSSQPRKTCERRTKRAGWRAGLRQQVWHAGRGA